MRRFIYDHTVHIRIGGKIGEFGQKSESRIVIDEFRIIVCPAVRRPPRSVVVHAVSHDDGNRFKQAEPHEIAFESGARDIRFYFVRILFYPKTCVFSLGVDAGDFFVRIADAHVGNPAVIRPAQIGNRCQKIGLFGEYARHGEQRFVVLVDEFLICTPVHFVRRVFVTAVKRGRPEQRSFVIRHRVFVQRKALELIV